MRAKLLFLAKVISAQYNEGNNTSMTSWLFSIMDVIDFFKTQKNPRSLGSYFMVLGCIYAMRSGNKLDLECRREMTKALLNIFNAEEIQSELVFSPLSLNQFVSEQEANNKSEDAMILAFRYFTHAVIILNFFLNSRKQSVPKCKCAEEKKKQESLVPLKLFWGMKRAKVQDCKNFEDNVIFLVDALENLYLCLDSLPTTSKTVDDKE